MRVLKLGLNCIPNSARFSPHPDFLKMFSWTIDSRLSVGGGGWILGTPHPALGLRM